MKTKTISANVDIASNSVEQDIIEAAGNHMAAEIDFEILTGFLIQLGWVKVVLLPMTWENGALIDLWVEQNIKGKFETMGLVWVFEKQSDANWFKLRWLG